MALPNLGINAPVVGLDDASLIASAQRGDLDAFGRLVEKHQARWTAVAYAITGCPQAAADVVQDAVVRGWQKLGQLQDHQRFAAWMTQIVRTVAINSRRGWHNKSRSDDALASTAVEAHQPIDAMANNERDRLIRDALGELDELTRQAVVLRYFDNRSSKEIAELLESTPAAIDMRLSRARSVLRERLAEVQP